MQRTTMTMMTMLLLAAPMAAQDTSITIQKTNSDTECSVRINGRQLSDAEAKPICARTERQGGLFRFQADSLRMQALELGDRSRVFSVETDSLARIMTRQMRLLEDQTRDLAERREFFSTVIGEAARARPLIGVSIDPAPRETDRYGAYIQAVTPGGPADKAGIRSGDIITKVAGKAIGSAEKPRDGSNQSLVSIKLIEAVGALEAGKAVRFDYRRDNNNRNVMITPMEERAVLVSRNLRELPLAQQQAIVGDRSVRYIDGVPVGPGAPQPNGRMTMTLPSVSAFTFTTGALARIEMAQVNEKLGSYFGVTSGVLVVNVPTEGNMNLQPGDVITAVDGRRIETPNEFLRVLRTYDAERSFKLQVTRQKRQEVITTTLP
jgi:membrane-associated protease RseP (regulator of RpoE activity)